LSSKFKTEIVHLAPVLSSMLFGVLCAYSILTSPIETVQITPFKEGNVESLMNGLYFVILVGIGATILYLLLRRKSHRLITLITGFAMTTAIFMLSLIYLWTVIWRFEFPYSDLIILVPPFFITALADYAIFRKGNYSASLIVLGIGGALGAFLGFTIPTQSTVFILGFLAVYDIFAVYRGPVGKIAHSGLEQFRGLSFSFKDMQMGLGDLTFYSMLSGHMLIYFGYLSCVASVIGVLFGCFLSFKMLEKKGMFPGLPFPILFGLTAGFLASLL